MSLGRFSSGSLPQPMKSKRRFKTFIILFLTVLALLPQDVAGLDIRYSLSMLKADAHNLRHFDRLSGKTPIQLFSAKNETISFQLVLTEDSKTKKPIQILKPRLSGPEVFQVKHITFFRLENCQTAFAPDCLMPMLDDSTWSLKGTAPVVMWVDISVPRVIAAGRYVGEIALRQGREPFSAIPIVLEVYDFTLPERPSLEVDLNNYGVSFLKKVGLQVGTHDAYIYEREIYRLARKHRMIFNPLPYKSQRGRPHPTMAPELVGEGEEIRVKNWTEYDQRYSLLFDGTLFENKIPIAHQYLPFNPEWPSSFGNYLNDRKKYETEWRLIAEAFLKHFKEKGWDQTIFQIFLNQKPNKNNRILWNLDEPKGTEDFNALRYYVDLTHHAFQDDPLFGFRLDISHFYCEKHRGHPQKDFEENRGEEILAPVDIWVISKHSMDDRFAQKKVLNLKRKGKKIYEYMAGKRMPRIQDPLIKGVRYAWHAWLRHEDGLVFWRSVKDKGEVSDGRNFLIYSENRSGKSETIASIRLKAVRRGAQDFEYLRLASKKGDVRKLLRPHLSGNGADDAALRKQLATMILSPKK